MEATLLKRATPINIMSEFPIRNMEGKTGNPLIMTLVNPREAILRTNIGRPKAKSGVWIYNFSREDRYEGSGFDA